MVLRKFQELSGPSNMLDKITKGLRVLNNYPSSASEVYENFATLNGFFTAAPKLAAQEASEDVPAVDVEASKEEKAAVEQDQDDVPELAFDAPNFQHVPHIKAARAVLNAQIQFIQNTILLHSPKYREFIAHLNSPDFTLNSVMRFEYNDFDNVEKLAKEFFTYILSAKPELDFTDFTYGDFQGNYAFIDRKSVV